MEKITSKIYFAIIQSNYQELNFKRLIEHFHIKDQIILIRYTDEKIQNTKLPKNVKKKTFLNKFYLLIYFLLVFLKNISFQKKFIFGNASSRFSIFLRIFINGKDQIYVDDGWQSIDFDYNRLKKGSSVFTVYNIKLPSKIKKIKCLPKYVNKQKKTLDEVLFVGSPLITDDILSKYQFIKAMKIISKKNKKFYYYPHRYEIDLHLLLPKNFKIIKRTTNIEEFIYNYKYNFKAIYSFGSSSVVEIANIYKKENIRIFDIRQWIVVSDLNYEKKKLKKKIIDYLRKSKIRIIQLKK